MPRRVLVTLAILACLLSLLISPVTAQPLTTQSRVALRGMGAVQIGMTVAEAERAIATRLVPYGPWAAVEQCYYVAPPGNSMNIGFMVSEGQIVRVDVWRESQIRTLSGAGIGDTEAHIQALYPGQIEITPHPYLGNAGHYLTFVPRDRADQNYRVIFETHHNRVTDYRAGKLPEVRWIEGCS